MSSFSTNTIEYIFDFYKKQKNELDSINKIQNWFIDIEKSPHDPNLLVITGNTGVGKCLDKFTKVLTPSFQLKYLHEINIDDYVLDQYKTSKKVIGITHGFIFGYFRITHSSINYSYNITPNHLLVLFDTINKKIVHLKASDYYALNNKHLYKALNVRMEQFDVNIEFVKNNLEYIGLTVEDNIFLIENEIITHNSNIVDIFLKKSNFDILNIGKLLDIYENTTHNYLARDFLEKIIKQKNVNKFDGISRNKLLLIDSLEEFFNLQKTIMRDIIERMEILKMPIIIISSLNFFENCEKKVKLKLNKVGNVIHFEPPNAITLTNYIKNILKLNVSNENITRLINISHGDIRYLNNMIEFQKIGYKKNIIDDKFIDTIHENFIDLEVNFEEVLKKIKIQDVSKSFLDCETEPFIFGMITYQNYIYNKSFNKKYITDLLCFGDKLEKVIFKTQQWGLLNTYIYFSTIYPWKLLEIPKKIHPSNTLQKFMNTKKRNKKYDLLF